MGCIIRTPQESETIFYVQSNKWTSTLLYKRYYSPSYTRNYKTTNYSFRNLDNITVPFCRKEPFRNSCITLSVSLWNNLDENIRNSSSFSSFKYEKKKKKKKKKNAITRQSTYVYCDRFLSVMHARIRNECSNLNSDLPRLFILLTVLRRWSRC